MPNCVLFSGGGFEESMKQAVFAKTYNNRIGIDFL